MKHTQRPVKVKGEWHVAWLAEWHNYVECNICKMTQRNKLNWKVRPFLAPINLQTQPLFLCQLKYDNNQNATKAHCRLAFFHTATKILLTFISRAAWQHRYYSTKVGHGRNGRSRSLPLYFFLQKMFARLTLQFLSTYIFLSRIYAFPPRPIIQFHLSL